MGLYPRNSNVPVKAQTDIDHLETSLKNVVCYAPGSPAVGDDDYFFASAAMKVGAYTLLKTAMPEAGIARKILVTVTQVGGVNDTMGTITFVGTDLADQPLTEVFTPTANNTKETASAFKTLTSATGAGWVRDGGAGTEDTIKIGTSESLGLPDKLTDTAQVLCASLNNVKEATAPTVTVDSANVGKNTVNLNSALNASAVKIYYLP